MLPLCLVSEKLDSDTLVRLGSDRYKSRLLKLKNCPIESRLRKVEEVGLYPHYYPTTLSPPREKHIW